MKDEGATRGQHPMIPSESRATLSPCQNWCEPNPLLTSCFSTWAIHPGIESQRCSVAIPRAWHSASRNLNRPWLTVPIWLPFFSILVTLSLVVAVKVPCILTAAPRLLVSNSMLSTLSRTGAQVSGPWSTGAIAASSCRQDLMLVASHMVSRSSWSRVASAYWPISTRSITGSIRLPASTSIPQGNPFLFSMDSQLCRGAEHFTRCQRSSANRCSTGPSPC